MRVWVLTRAILAGIIATIISVMTIFDLPTPLLVGVAVFLMTYFAQHRARKDKVREMTDLDR